MLSINKKILFGTENDEERIENKPFTFLDLSPYISFARHFGLSYIVTNTSLHGRRLFFSRAKGEISRTHARTREGRREGLFSPSRVTLVRSIIA